MRRMQGPTVEIKIACGPLLKPWRSLSQHVDCEVCEVIQISLTKDLPRPMNCSVGIPSTFKTWHSHFRFDAVQPFTVIMSAQVNQRNSRGAWERQSRFGHDVERTHTELSSRDRRTLD